MANFRGGEKQVRGGKSHGSPPPLNKTLRQLSASILENLKPLQYQPHNLSHWDIKQELVKTWIHPTDGQMINMIFALSDKTKPRNTHMDAAKTTDVQI